MGSGERDASSCFATFGGAEDPDWQVVLLHDGAIGQADPEFVGAAFQTVLRAEESNYHRERIKR